MLDFAQRPGTSRWLGALAVMLACAAIAPGSALAFDQPFIGSFNKVSLVGSTVPSNGDLNPYGIVNVTKSVGSLVAGNILISNFNNGGEPPTGNLQGTGSTIVQVTPGGKLSLFAQINPATLPGPCPGGVGLTTALALLPQGYVVVGSLPTTNGMSATAQAGCLIVLDSSGHPVETISGAPINGPWDMTSVGEGAKSTLFVTNVLNGTVAAEGMPVDEGTVVRIRLKAREHKPPKVTATDVIASEFPERTDPAALVVGPTGVALGSEGTLYVADTQGNRIAAVPNAMTRQMPLGRRRQDGRRGRLSQQPPRHDPRSERRPPDGQCQRWEHRRDHACRSGVPAGRHRRRRRRAVRARSGAELQRRLLRERRRKHAGPAALTSHAPAPGHLPGAGRMLSGAHRGGRGGDRLSQELSSTRRSHAREHARSRCRKARRSPSIHRQEPADEHRRHRGPRSGPPRRHEPPGEAQRDERRADRRARRRAARRGTRSGSVLCVVVRGEGAMFSSGMDFSSLGALAGEPQRLREFRTGVLDAWNLCEEMTKPTIAQIHGGCIGGAMELALACDLRTMAADAVIGLVETRVGLIPDVGGSSRLPSVVGLGRAKEMIMASKMIDGTEAERIGLVNRVAPADELDAATDTLVAGAARLRPRRRRPCQARARRLGQAGARRDARAGGHDPADLRRKRRLRRGRTRLRREAPARVQRARDAQRRPVDGPGQQRVAAERAAEDLLHARRRRRSGRAGRCRWLCPSRGASTRGPRWRCCRLPPAAPDSRPSSPKLDSKLSTPASSAASTLASPWPRVLWKCAVSSTSSPSDARAAAKNSRTWTRVGHAGGVAEADLLRSRGRSGARRCRAPARAARGPHTGSRTTSRSPPRSAVPPPARARARPPDAGQRLGDRAVDVLAVVRL